MNETSPETAEPTGADDYVPPGEPGGEDAPALPPDFTPEDPSPPVYVPPPSDDDAEYT